MIVLDHGPTFLDGLHTWPTWVKCWVPGDGARELEVTHDEHGERSKSHLIFILVTSVLTIIVPNHPAEPPLATSNDLHNMMLQLG